MRGSRLNYNGCAGELPIFLDPVPDRIHVLNSCDMAANLPAGECVPVITRPDGSLVIADSIRARTRRTIDHGLVGVGLDR